MQQRGGYWRRLEEKLRLDITSGPGEAIIEDLKLLDHPKKVLIDWTPYEEKENELHAAFFDKGDISASANRTASPPPLLSSVKP